MKMTVTSAQRTFTATLKTILPYNLFLLYLYCCERERKVRSRVRVRVVLSSRNLSGACAHGGFVQGVTLAGARDRDMVRRQHFIKPGQRYRVRMRLQNFSYFELSFHLDFVRNVSWVLRRGRVDLCACTPSAHSAPKVHEVSTFTRFVTLGGQCASGSRTGGEGRLAMACTGAAARLGHGSGPSSWHPYQTPRR